MTHSLQAIVAAAVQSTPFQEKVAVPLMVALIGFTGVLATVTITTVAGRWAQATNRRRDAYAAAIATLVAWAEYPYRIRRRTSDDPVELARLAGLSRRPEVLHGTSGERDRVDAVASLWSLDLPDTVRVPDAMAASPGTRRAAARRRIRTSCVP
jgi:hypothetical protein